MLRRTSIVAVAAAGLVVAGGAPAALAQSTPQAHRDAKITGGKVSVSLDPTSVTALLAAGFGVSTSGKASLTGTTLSFPVVGGTYAKGTGTIDESGGIAVSKGSAQVSIKNIHVNLKTRTGTAVVSGHGRISAVAVSKPTTTGRSGRKVTISGYTVRMSKKLVKILDKKFSTTFFAKHATLGTGTTTIKLKG